MTIEQLKTLDLVLASGSPRRAELLSAAGFQFSVRVANVDETPVTGEPPVQYVGRLSAEKASAVAREGEIVLGADTTVVVDDQILGKPLDREDAVRMLSLLSGRWHEVLTGLSIVSQPQVNTEIAVTRVKFAEMSKDEIEWYATSGEPDDKAGAYAIQGLGSRFIERIEGSYSNVVGLPLETLYRMLRAGSREA
jgi:septum formation protein